MFPARWRLGVMGFVVAACSTSGLAQEVQVTECRAMPESGVIDEPGRYCLTEDFVSDSVPAIEIRADNVEIDLGGHEVRPRSEPPAQDGIGISADEQANIRIHNGSLAGWWFALSLAGIDGLTVENLEISRIYNIGLNATDSRNVLVRGNRLHDFLYGPSQAPIQYAVGVNLGAQNCAIIGNHIVTVPPEGNPSAIDFETVHILLPAESSSNCLIRENVLRATRPTPRAYGIWIGLQNQAVASHNRIENQQYGITIDREAKAILSQNVLRMAPGEPADHGLADTFGVYAPEAEVLLLGNEVENYSYPLVPGDRTRIAAPDER
jgi:hypothetical protein